MGDNEPDTSQIIRFDTFVTLLGGGECDPADLAEALTLAPVLCAADGGADTALALGHCPRHVVGDLDSLSLEARAALPPASLTHVAEQDSTDFEKCLARIEAPGLLALGFTGGRSDHEMAAWHAILRFAHRPCIVMAREDIVFAAPPRIALNLAPETRLSLFPLTEVAGRSRGLKWEIDGLRFAPGQCIGTSNLVAQDRVELWFDTPGMLVILPKTALDAAMEALF